MLPHSLFSDGSQNRLHFSLDPFFLLKSLYSEGTSIGISPSGTQKVLPTSVGGKDSIGPTFLTSFPSMTLIRLLFSIALLAIALPLTSPLLPPLSPYVAPGRCFRTWVVTTNQFYKLSLFLWSFAPTSVPLPLIFKNYFAFKL